MLRSISIFSGILPIIFFILFFKRNRKEGLWVILFYSFLSFLIDNSYNRLPVVIVFYVFSTFTIIEYTLFTIFLYRTVKEKIIKYILAVGSIIFYAIAIFSLFSEKKETFDSLPASVESILAIIYIICFLYEQIKDPQNAFIYYSKQFWIVLAFFLYFSSTLFLFVYADNLTNEQHNNYWNINFIFNILKNTLFSLSFAMKKKDKTAFSIENPYSDLY